MNRAATIDGTAAAATAANPIPLYRRLYVQVLCAITIGALLAAPGREPLMPQSHEGLWGASPHFDHIGADTILFIVVVLGAIAHFAGFSLWRFSRYIREEILIVLGTSTSESALPGLMAKLEALGCDKSLVGLVVPTGYSFNLDGTSIYLSMAVLFIAQAAHVDLSWQQQLGIVGLLLLTSKGAAAVTGGGFIALAATLSSIESLPVAGLALLLGVDRFMSEARAITNLIGNGVATIVIARLEGCIDRDQMQRVLSDL